jgi:hypothetical protein
MIDTQFLTLLLILIDRIQGKYDRKNGNVECTVLIIVLIIRPSPQVILDFDIEEFVQNF